MLRRVNAMIKAAGAFELFVGFSQVANRRLNHNDFHACFSAVGRSP